MCVYVSMRPCVREGIHVCVCACVCDLQIILIISQTHWCVLWSWKSKHSQAHMWRHTSYDHVIRTPCIAQSINVENTPTLLRINLKQMNIPPSNNKFYLCWNIRCEFYSCPFILQSNNSHQLKTSVINWGGVINRIRLHFFTVSN